MSVLDRVREKFQTPMSGTSKASTSPSAGSGGTRHRHSKSFSPPSAGSAGPLPARSEIDATGDTEPDPAPWRQELLRMLNARADVKRAFIAEAGPNGGGLVRLAIRDIGTCELVIPDGRFDPFAIMKLFEELQPTDCAAKLRGT